MRLLFTRQDILTKMTRKGKGQTYSIERVIRHHKSVIDLSNEIKAKENEIRKMKTRLERDEQVLTKRSDWHHYLIDENGITSDDEKITPVLKFFQNIRQMLLIGLTADEINTLAASRGITSSTKVQEYYQESDFLFD